MLLFEHLQISYGNFAAVKDLCLELRAGEMLTLLGPSGCGKSTTLKAAGGFLTPASGRIFLKGEDITALPPERRPTATVFQNHALFPHMTVGENVAYGLRVRGMGRSERQRWAEEAVEEVSLKGLALSRVQELSGGQQQRVALARALVLKPQVLLLDEPLSSLDARLRVKMRQEIRALQQDLAISTIYVTHDQEEALSVSDRVAVMDSGQLVQVGTPEDVYFRPQNDFVADFIGDAFPVTLNGARRLIRPDQIVPDDSGPLEGRLTGRDFLGASVELTLQWESQSLRCRLPSSAAAVLPAGETLRFRFDLDGPKDPEKL